MADAADDKTRSEEERALDETLIATPGSSGGGRPVPADATALEVDHSDRYALGDVHAAGGLGRVMRARDRRLHRTVAVKELLQRTPAAEARFVREALITAQLEHPGIVPVHDAGRWPSGEPYYSMKLVSGRTLRDLIQSKKALDERLSLVPNAIAVAEAIAYAHSRDVIHRDIKPPNVLVGDFGETLVIDWGLAKDLSGRVAEPAAEVVAVDSGSDSGDLATAVGNVLGTPAYMSPEQARGEELDARADVYSLGALLYEVLTGKPPHDGPSVQEVLDAAQKGAVVPVEQREPDAPPDLCAIVSKAMAAERADRYPTAMELAADLRRFQTGKLVTARQYSTRALVGRWMARHRAILAVVIAAVLALAVVAVVSFRRVMSQRNRAETQMRLAESRSEELVFRQAQSLIERDPTAALAVLKAYPIDGKHARHLAPMIDDALAGGVARHVLVHRDWVLRLAFTTDGSLFTADQEGNLTLWDMATGRARHLGHHDGDPYVAMAPDGSSLAVGRPRGIVEIHSTDGAVRRLTGLPGVPAAYYSADGRRVVGLASGVVIRVWEVASGAQLFALDREEGQAATLSPDGTFLYVARPSGEIAAFEVDRAGPPRIVTRLREPATFLKTSPDGAQLVIQNAAHDVELIELATGTVRVLGNRPKSFDGAMEFSHARDRIAMTAADSTIVIFHLSGAEPTVLRGHTDPAYRLLFSRDDARLFSSGDDGTVRIWHLDTGESQVLRGHRDDVVGIAVSSDERWLASASLDGTVRVWPLGPGPARVLPGRIKSPRGLVFAAGGARLLAGNKERETEAWDVASGRGAPVALERSKENDLVAIGDRRVLAVDPAGRPRLLDLISGETRVLPAPANDPIQAVGIAKDDRRAVTAHRSGALLLWDVAAGAGRPVAVDHPPTMVTFLPGRREVVLGGPGFLELWDLEAGRALSRARFSDPEEFDPYDLQVSNDGRVIAARDRRVQHIVVWQTAGDQVQLVDGSDAQHISLSPDGAVIAMALGDRTVRLISTASGADRVLAGHTDLVNQAVFSPDGRTIASCSFDRTVRLWTADGEFTRVLRGHQTEVRAVAFSPDGATLASIGVDGTVRLWPLAALPDVRPAAVPARLAAATSALVDADGNPFTPGE